MEDKKRKSQLKLWLGAVFWSIIAFLIVKLLWEDANPILLLVFLILGFLINFIITLRNQSFSGSSY
ncbi:hypothetical protein [Pontibacillus salipaludis]|uniref:Uncharacterized protein n=1 Tax=Pontibacillus salipaludis TaxID=1697394 RepID=A0ABQ1Q5E8_9BACI|nr:hypothetical protein [Pontibacillus salipaludis]GGD13567.1 hypothetical protein GCM10011389_21490 [Pontibacillus salipaludis]